MGSKSEFQDVAVDLIDIGGQNIREVAEDDSIGELAQDIATRGLLQPIGVTPAAGGRLQLRWGLRRLLAHRRLGRKKILARVWVAGDDDVKAVALVENLHRQQLTLGEEVEAVRYLGEVQGKSVESIAALLSKSRGWVLNRLMVPSLPDFISEPLLSGDIRMAHVEILGRVTDEAAQRYLVASIIQQRWTAGQLKSIADIYINSPSVGEVPMAHHPHSPEAPAAQAVRWFCEACGVEGSLEAFRLVRVCANGCRPEHVGGGTDSQSHRGDGVEGRKHKRARHNSAGHD